MALSWSSARPQSLRCPVIWTRGHVTSGNQDSLSLLHLKLHPECSELTLWSYIHPYISIIMTIVPPTPSLSQPPLYHHHLSISIIITVTPPSPPLSQSPNHQHHYHNHHSIIIITIIITWQFFPFQTMVKFLHLKLNFKSLPTQTDVSEDMRKSWQLQKLKKTIVEDDWIHLPHTYILPRAHNSADSVPSCTKSMLVKCSINSDIHRYSMWAVDNCGSEVIHSTALLT